MKRLVDIIFAVFWLILTAPIMLIIAVLIRLDSPDPVLYTPNMVGLDGKIFRLYRFRIMHTDKRLTRIGRFIRNYSLDHLPMLFNLLNGTMTIVGPRPQEEEAVDMRQPVWQQYFRVKPGLVNYAVLKMGKTYGHYQAGNMALKQELELDYIRKRSVAGDLRLFLEGMRAHIASGGNIKARGEPDPEVAKKLQDTHQLKES